MGAQERDREEPIVHDTFHFPVFRPTYPVTSFACVAWTTLDPPSLTPKNTGRKTRTREFRVSGLRYPSHLSHNDTLGVPLPGRPTVVGDQGVGKDTQRRVTVPWGRKRFRTRRLPVGDDTRRGPPTGPDHDRVPGDPSPPTQGDGRSCPPKTSRVDTPDPVLRLYSPFPGTRLPRPHDPRPLPSTRDPEGVEPGSAGLQNRRTGPVSRTRESS